MEGLLPPERCLKDQTSQVTQSQCSCASAARTSSVLFLLSPRYGGLRRKAANPPYELRTNDLHAPDLRPTAALLPLECSALLQRYHA